LAEDQATYGIVLIGGDTTATPGPLTLSATAIGEVPKGEMIRRRGAKAGDGVWVSGNIGNGALGLRCLRGLELGLPRSLAAQCVAHYRTPEPRLALGAKLRGLAHASLDVSDGLIADLGHLCAASSVGAEIFADGVPLSAAGRRALAAGTVTLPDLLTGGDDYELVFAVSSKDEGKLARIVRLSGVKATKIGRVVRGTSVTVSDAQGRAVDFSTAGYAHF
jgi:thiamine-monophosphate kinase